MMYNNNNNKFITHIFKVHMGHSVCTFSFIGERNGY